MERLTESTRPRYEDKDVAIWVCPEAHSVEEMGVEGPVPPNVFCGRCGKPMVMGCSRKDCPDPIYHPSDFYRDFHRVCQEPIPWARARSRIVWAGPQWSSNLVGQVKPAKREDRIQLEKSSGRQFATEGESGVAVRYAKIPEPRSEPERGITWDELENLDRRRVAEIQTPSPARKWWNGLSGVAKWIVGIVGGIVTGVALLLIRSWLISQGLVAP